MDVVSETPPAPRGDNRLDAVVGWAALATSTGAVLAWAACCVLPMALALAGTGTAATATIAGQRSWVTGAAALTLAAGWILPWRGAPARGPAPGCPPPSHPE